MEDVDKEPEEKKTSLQDLLFFVEKFGGHNAGAGHDINSGENNARINQQEQQAPQYMTIEQRSNSYNSTLAAATGMTYMPSIRELGYLNQTSLLRKDFKIGRVLTNAGQNDRLSFVSLSHQINDGSTTRKRKRK